MKNNSSSKSVLVILNPIAGGGRGKKLINRLVPALEKRFANNYELIYTSKPLEATDIARQGIINGAEVVIAVGGDGTINEVTNGFFYEKKLINPLCELGVINCSTGGGLAHTLGLPHSIGDQLEIAGKKSTHLLDIGYIKYTDSKNQERKRFFISECQVGIGGAVVSQVDYRHKLFGGMLAFGYIAVKHALFYNPVETEVILEGGNLIQGKMIGIVVGNGNYCAGGMRLTPDASPFDDHFDILTISDMNFLERIKGFLKIYSGKHIALNNFNIYTSRRVEIKSAVPVAVEADGELLGTTPCFIQLNDEKIRIRCLL